MRRFRLLWIHKPGWFLITNQLTLLIMIALMAVLLVGCDSLGSLSSRSSNPPAPSRTKVELPSTWTLPPPTSTVTPSFTPSPTASPTITPTSTYTSTPPASLVPTLVSSEPKPTTDWGSVRLPDCTFTATETGVRILPAPFIDPYHVLPTMEPGKPYPAVITKPTYSLLFENGESLGWVDYRLLAVSLDGDDCLTEYDDREYWDFPLCFFTPLGEIFGYSDAEFTKPMHDLSPPRSLVVLYQSETYYFSAFGDSGPSFVVKREEVFTHGNCDDIPTLAKARIDTSLYSDLPNQGGVIVHALAVDDSIFTQSQTRNGPPPPGELGSGYWILARRHSWAENINGWVWSGHIENK